MSLNVFQSWGKRFDHTVVLRDSPETWVKFSCMFSVTKPLLVQSSSVLKLVFTPVLLRTQTTDRSKSSYLTQTDPLKQAKRGDGKMQAFAYLRGLRVDDLWVIPAHKYRQLNDSLLGGKSYCPWINSPHYGNQRGSSPQRMDAGKIGSEFFYVVVVILNISGTHLNRGPLKQKRELRIGVAHCLTMPLMSLAFVQAKSLMYSQLFCHSHLRSDQGQAVY